MSPEHPEAETRGLDGNASLVSEGRRLKLTNGQKVGIAGLVAFVFIAFIWVDNSVHTKKADKQVELSVKPVPPAFRQAPIALPPGPQQPARQAAPKDVSATESPIMAFADKPAAEADPRRPGGQIVPSLAPGDQGGLASRLKPTELSGTKATLLPHPDMMLTKGTIIPCTLQTAINTELAGFAKCILPEAVRSTTGNVVLLDRGTVVVGEIQSGLVQGQSRVFILWDRAETPDHAIVTLASPGTDELGRSGVPGIVDEHFWDRFGSAIMLSVIQGGLQAGAAAAGGPGGSSGSGSGTGIYLNNFQTNGQQIANTALQSSINIPPTLEKNQGDNVSIFVARDIDFSTVYSLSMAH